MTGPQTKDAAMLECGHALAGKLTRRANIIKRMGNPMDRKYPGRVEFLSEKLARTENELRELCKQYLELLGD